MPAPKRTLVSTLLLTLLLALISGCRDKAAPPVESTQAQFEIEELTGEELTAAAKSLAEGNSGFALETYRQLATMPGNLFFSPWSISSACGMAYGGAGGETAEQMAHALQFPLGQSRLHPAFAELVSNLTAAQEGGGVTLSIANSLWPQQDYPFLDSYLSLVRDYYGSEVTAVDYQNAPEEARLQVNAWVEEKTNDKIEELIQPGMFNRMTRLVLVNAIHFLGNWKHQFDSKHTYTAPFHHGKGGSTDVEMMRQTKYFGYADCDSLQLLQLPYKESGLSMLVLLPTARDGLAELEAGFTTTNLNAWRERLSVRKVDVALPSFELTGEFELSNALQEMGMTNPFDPQAADFSGMDGRKGSLFISAVVHKAFVNVNETGTEAAAATGLVMVTSSLPDWPSFRADHPFIFLIQDDATGSILFLGRLVDPE